MSFLLDTNILSHHMRGAPGLTHRFIHHSGRLALPAVVLAELYAGAHLLNDLAPLRAKIADLLSFIDVIDFDAACAEAFGRLRGDLHRTLSGAGGEGKRHSDEGFATGRVAVVGLPTMVPRNGSRGSPHGLDRDDRRPWFAGEPRFRRLGTAHHALRGEGGRCPPHGTGGESRDEPTSRSGDRVRGRPGRFAGAPVRRPGRRRRAPRRLPRAVPDRSSTRRGPARPRRPRRTWPRPS